MYGYLYCEDFLPEKKFDYLFIVKLNGQKRKP